MNYVGMKTSNNTIEFYPKYTSSPWPTGSIYIQFPGEAAPADLLGGNWQNVSSQYAGMFFRTPDGAFFRAEGGDASTFGSGNQSANTYTSGTWNLSSSGTHCHSYTGLCSSSTYCTALIGGVCISGCNCCGATVTVSTNNWSHTHSVTNVSTSKNDNETRPTNYTIRIWEKIL